MNKLVNALRWVGVVAITTSVIYTAAMAWGSFRAVSSYKGFAAFDEGDFWSSMAPLGFVWGGLLALVVIIVVAGVLLWIVVVAKKWWAVLLAFIFGIVVTVLIINLWGKVSWPGVEFWNLSGLALAIAAASTLLVTFVHIGLPKRTKPNGF